MSIWATVSLWLWAYLLSQAWARQIAALEHAEKELARLQALARCGLKAGSISLPAHDTRVANLLCYVGSELERARRAGLPSHASLAELRRCLRRLLRLERRARARWQTFATRCWGGLALLLGVRAFVVEAPVEARLLWSLALALGLLLWALRVSFPPCSWGLGSSQAAVIAWFACHLDGAPRLGMPLETSVRELARRELRWGVDLLAEKRRLLSAWAQQEHARQRKALARWVEVFPAAELLGLGAAFACLLGFELLGAPMLS